MKKIIGAAMFGIAALFGLTVLLGSYYTVNAHEVVVLTRNGAVVGTEGAGLHFKTPFIESVVFYQTSNQTWTNGTGDNSQMEAYTKDLQPANLRVTINYQIDPTLAQDFYTHFGNGDAFETSILQPTVYSAVKIIVGQYDSSTAISNRAAMVDKMKEQIQKSLPTKDVMITAFQLENISFSDDFVKAVEDRMRQEIQVQQRAQVLQQEVINANIVRTKAQGQADAVVMQAKADAQQVELMGDAQAKAIKARAEALGANPGLVALTMAEKWNGNLPTTMVPGGALPFLSLGQQQEGVKQ